MKIKQLKSLGHCLVIGLIIILTMVLSACGSSKSPSTTTETQASSSNTIITTTTTTTTTKSSPSSKTTTTKVTATLVSIAITPNPAPNLKLGPTTITFIATGTYSDGSTADISSSVKWTSSDPTIAEFTQPSGGQLTGIKVGSITITVTLSGITSQPLNVTVIGSALPQ
jgi:hypothetical protein